MTASAERGSVSTALDQQRNATGVVNAITAQQIARSPDSDAAAAVQRVSGVTVQDGRYVSVRGLGERYTTDVAQRRARFRARSRSGRSSRSTSSRRAPRRRSPPARRSRPTSRATSAARRSTSARASSRPSGRSASRDGGQHRRRMGGRVGPGATPASSGSACRPRPRGARDVHAPGPGDANLTAERRREPDGDSLRNAWRRRKRRPRPTDRSAPPRAAPTRCSVSAWATSLRHLLHGQEARGRVPPRRWRAPPGIVVDRGTTAPRATTVLLGGIAELQHVARRPHAHFPQQHIQPLRGSFGRALEHGTGENLGLELEIHRLGYVERSVRSTQRRRRAPAERHHARLVADQRPSRARTSPTGPRSSSPSARCRHGPAAPARVAWHQQRSRRAHVRRPRGDERRGARR